MEKGKKIKNRQEKINIALYIFVVLSFIVPIIYIAAKMLFGNIPMNEAGYHSYSDYVLMIAECVVGLAAINVPLILSKQFKFEIPLFLYGMYIVFLYCAIFLGEVRSFYYVIPQWDLILHTFSSLMLGFFGFMVITILNHNENIAMNLSPAFTAVFAFCFALSFGTLWEIYEYLADGVLGFNMQKFITADGTVLAGHAALSDTMGDIIIDAIGALISSVIGCIAIKKDKKWMYPRLKDKTDKKDNK